MMFEVAYFEGGELVRGGIKADFDTASEWAMENAKRDRSHDWLLVPASPDAITEEELYAKLDALMAGQNE